MSEKGQGQGKGQGYSGPKILKLKKWIGEDRLVHEYGRKCQQKTQPWIFSEMEYENLDPRTKEKYETDPELIKRVVDKDTSKSLFLVCPRMVNTKTNQVIDDETEIENIQNGQMEGQDMSDFVMMNKSLRFPTLTISEDNKWMPCCSQKRPSAIKRKSRTVSDMSDTDTADTDTDILEIIDKPSLKNKKYVYTKRGSEQLEMHRYRSVASSKWNDVFPNDKGHLFKMMKSPSLLDCFLYPNEKESVILEYMNSFFSFHDFLRLTHGNILNLMKDLELTMEMDFSSDLMQQIFVISREQKNRETQRILEERKDPCWLKLDAQKKKTEKYAAEYDKTMTIWLTCYCQCKNLFSPSVFPHIRNYPFFSTFILEILHLCFPNKPIYLVKESDDEGKRELFRWTDDHDDDDDGDGDGDGDGEDMIVLLMERDERNKQDYHYYSILPMRNGWTTETETIVKEMFEGLYDDVDDNEDDDAEACSFFSLLSATEKIKQKWETSLVLNSQAKVIGVKLEQKGKEKEKEKENTEQEKQQQNVKTMILPTPPTMIPNMKTWTTVIKDVILSCDLRFLRSDMDMYFEPFQDNECIEKRRRHIYSHIQSVRLSIDPATGIGYPYLFRVYSSEVYLFLNLEVNGVKKIEDQGKGWPMDSIPITDYLKEFQLMYLVFRDREKQKAKEEMKQVNEEATLQLAHQQEFQELQKRLKSIFTHVLDNAQLSIDKRRIRKNVKEMREQFGKHTLDIHRVKKTIQDLLLLPHPWTDTYLPPPPATTSSATASASYVSRMAFEIVHQLNMYDFYFSPFVMVPTQDKRQFDLSLDYFSNLRQHEIVFAYSDLDFVSDNLTFLNSSFFSFHQSEIPDYEDEDEERD